MAFIISFICRKGLGGWIGFWKKLRDKFCEKKKSSEINFVEKEKLRDKFCKKKRSEINFVKRNVPRKIF
jgi:hypothetical protein